MLGLILNECLIRWKLEEHVVLRQAEVKKVRKGGNGPSGGRQESLRKGKV